MKLKTAERIAKQFGDDGQCFRDGAGRAIDGVCVMRGARRIAYYVPLHMRGQAPYIRACLQTQNFPSGGCLVRSKPTEECGM